MIIKFQKGDFVIDKKDLTNYERFAIWRIDAGRLLQKFEPIIKDGVLVAHKALSTVGTSPKCKNHAGACLIDNLNGIDF